MRLDDIPLELEPIAGAVQAWHAVVDAETWRGACSQASEMQGRLMALWGSDRGTGSAEGGIIAGADAGRIAVHAVLAVQSSLVWLTHLAIDETFPDIADIFPAANRMQRAAFDLAGVRAVPARDVRPWIRHGAWPADGFPLRKDFDPQSRFTNLPDNYRFVRVEGEGVHEIPVGPVHAGTIEPGHFRFSVLGERVLRLEEHLGYKHKGIEKRFEQMTLAEGARLAGRISGDATVAYAWAYAMAVESATECPAPPRALWLRALFLERERIANHLGDLGFLGNDAGFAFGLSQFSRLKEDMVRLHHELFGHRYLMDAIVPGGVARDIDAIGLSQISSQSDTLRAAIEELHQIYDDHAGVQDRFNATGTVTPELARQLGLTGPAGRASGVAFDARVQNRSAPYDELDCRLVSHAQGDVAARARQRFDEAIESLRLCDVIVGRLSDSGGVGDVGDLDSDGSGDAGRGGGLQRSAIATDLPPLHRDAIGLGFVESWRGPVMIAIEARAGHRIDRLHAHDPSWQNWPVLEHAIIGNIVPDFPLINKSFNLSYSGHDL